MFLFNGFVIFIYVSWKHIMNWWHIYGIRYAWFLCKVKVYPVLNSGEEKGKNMSNFVWFSVVEIFLSFVKRVFHLPSLFNWFGFVFLFLKIKNVCTVKSIKIWSWVESAKSRCRGDHGLDSCPDKHYELQNAMMWPIFYTMPKPIPQAQWPKY